MPLTITIPAQDLYDPEANLFIPIKETTINLEHSLVSLSKWEKKWKKPFLSPTMKDKMTVEMLLDYVRCMTLTQNVDPIVYKGITEANLKEIQAYLEDPMTATVITNKRKDPNNNKQFMTSELIYAYMVILRIPFECQKWHLNRLLTLIQVVGIEQEPKKKGSRAEAIKQHQAINKARRARVPRR